MAGTIITGIVVAVCGVMITIFSEKLYQWFGRIAFAEKYLGVEGGTRMFYRLLGVVLFFGGLMWASGAIQRGFVSLFS